MALLERIYTIPLRKGVMQAPRTRRAKKAIFVLRAFIEHHMKSEDIFLSESLNEHIWQNGMRNPIMKVTVAVTKDDKNKVVVRLATEKAQASGSTKTDRRDAKTESRKNDTKSPNAKPDVEVKAKVVESKPAKTEKVKAEAKTEAKVAAK